jgi:1,4-alpha-glucan branching enzyme
MGANTYSDAGGSGTTFRVWSLFAKQIFVAGTFNGWSTTATELFSENNGFWSADVPTAHTGDSYKYSVVPTSGSPLWRMDPYASQITHDDKNSLNAVISSSDVPYGICGFTTPNWNEMVIYELDIGTFAQGNGLDGNGSFLDAAGKLDYLQQLGINAIEVMPIGQFIGNQSAGYNPAYIFAIEDEFGGPDGFRKFVNEAHERGIAVIVDVVYNHLGNSAGDMWQFDGWPAPQNTGGIYFYNDWRNYTAWGNTRFDYGRGEVRQYLRDNAMRRLQERYADGLRWDSVGSIRNVYDRDQDPGDDLPDGWSLMQWINSEIAQAQPWKISIAEDMKENEWITKDVGAGGAGFDAQWGAQFVAQARGALIPSSDSDRSMASVAWLIGQKYNAAAFQRVIYTESHDADSFQGAQRLPESIWPGNADSWAAKKRSTLGAAMVMTAPGIPMIFMGQEFLSWGHFDPNVALDWSNQTKFPGIVNLYRDLIHLRRDWFNSTTGLKGQNVNVYHVNDNDKLVAFHRWENGGPGDDVVVLLNFGNRSYPSYTIGMPASGMWEARFNSDSNLYDPGFGNYPTYGTEANGPGMDGLAQSANISIGPYTAVIFSQD